MRLDHDLITAWREFDAEEPPYRFPLDDGAELDQYSVVYGSFEDYVASRSFAIDRGEKLHLGLHPVPYAGSLERASVFILMLNPGLNHSDYYAEGDSGFRRASRATLLQSELSEDYPNMFLDPQFAWHPGFVYWERRLRDIAAKLLEMPGIRDYGDALKKLSQEIAFLELLPYHSASFGAHSLLRTLESARLMKQYVHEVLVPLAEFGEVLIIATRKVEHWGLEGCGNCILYAPNKSRAASLSLTKSVGGPAIARKLGIDI